GVTELVADLVLDLAGHREHAARGLLAWAAGGNDDRAVGALAALLQPGALGLDIDARVCGGRARVGRRAGLLLWRWLRGRLRCTDCLALLQRTRCYGVDEVIDALDHRGAELWWQVLGLGHQRVPGVQQSGHAV